MTVETTTEFEIGTKITEGEEEYIEIEDIEKKKEAYKIFMHRLNLFLDDDAITIYPRLKVRGAQKVKGPEEKTHVLEDEVEWLRELLNDRSCGVGLMRVSLVCGVLFFMFFLIGAYTPLVLMHPVVSILGFIGSLGFFCIGWINSKP